MSGILLWVAFGALIGWVAGAIFKDSAGILANIIIGIIGAVAGGLIFNYARGVQLSDFSIGRFSFMLLVAAGLVYLRHVAYKQWDDYCVDC